MMAGDWIKMRSDLFTHPKVVRMSSALQADTIRTVGGLMFVWTLFDAHSVDGEIEGYTKDSIDNLLRWNGFSDAMMSVHWLVAKGESLVLPEFDTHNGASAKRRAQDSDRKRNVRKMSASQADVCPQSVRKTSALEKRREQKIERAIPPNPHEHDEAADLLGDRDQPDRPDPLQPILDAYHRLLPKCERVEVLNPKRRKRLLAAVKLAKSVCKSQQWPYQAAEFWDAYFGECATDPWMRGEIPNPRNLRWRQNLDVLLAEDRFASVMDRAIGSMREAA